MTAEPEIQALDGPPQTGRLGDVVIVTAMTLVAIAVGIGLSLHLGLPMIRSAIAGGLILTLLLGLHFFILRAPKISAAAPDLMDETMWQELKARRASDSDGASQAAEADLASGAPKSDSRPREGARGGSASELSATLSPESTSQRPSRIVAAPPLPTISATATDPNGQGQWSDRISEGLRGTLPADHESAGAAESEAGHSPSQQADVYDDATAADETQSIESYWSYRPRTVENEPTLSTSFGAEPAAAPDLGDGRIDPAGQASAPTVEPQPTTTPSPADEATAETVPVSPRAHDVELVQRMIKKLAQDVNAAELLARGASADGASNTQSSASDTQVRSAMGLQTSVDALRKTSDVMRGQPPAAPATASQSADDQKRYRRVNELSNAIADNRLAVQLEPVMGLEDHRARHFEVTISVKSSSGAMLGEPDADKTFQGTGLLPKFDRERLAKTRAVAAQLGQRGKVGGVFSHIFGESLTDREFCFNVAASGISDESFAKRLILTLPQAHARAFGPRQWQTLHEFRELGFRFALSNITDLDMDFERLVASGCAFVKLDADVFFNGLHVADGGFVPAEDITRYLRSLGVSLIVENISDADKLSRLYDGGVLLGQGQLFGGPRTLKADAISGSDHQAA